MKSKITVLSSAIAVSCLALQVSAEAPRLGHLQKANEIIGMEVKNPQDQKLGKVKDLAIDMASGRIVEVFLSTGGFIGLGDKIVAVPPAAFTCDAAGKVLVINADQEKIKTAPEFEMSKWAESIRNSRVVDVYHFFGQEPYFVADDQIPGSPSPATENLSNVEKASVLMRLPVKNLYAEKLGKVENFILDLANGRVAEVVVSSGGFLGMGDELSVVPPKALHLNSERDTLSLNATKEALKNAPHFRSSEWPDLSQPTYVGGVYSAYHIEPYFSTAATSKADSTAHNSSNLPANALIPLSQGDSVADQNRTAQIRKEVLAGKGMSINSRSVQIATVNGRVTLRGPVDTAEEKNLIRAIADRIAQSENVDNQIEVKSPLSLK